MLSLDHDPSSCKNKHLSILHYFVRLWNFHVQLKATLQCAFLMVLLILYLKWKISTNVLMQFLGKICCLVTWRHQSELLHGEVILRGLYTEKGIKTKQMLNFSQEKKKKVLSLYNFGHFFQFLGFPQISEGLKTT